MNNSDNIQSRRKFFKELTVLGAGAVAGTALVSTTAHSSGEKVKVLDQNNNLIEVEKSLVSASKLEVDFNDLQKRGREGIPGKKFTMVIDLGKCQNARKCMEACQDSHQLKPEMHHINVLEMPDAVNGGTFYMPKQCQHCDSPPCVSVCPVGATFKRVDGIVLVDNEMCIGCRFCVAACPYSARTFNWTEPKDSEKYEGTAYNMELNVPQKKGTVSKCVFCADKLREEKLPRCVSSCPNGVYYFGDANEDLVTNGTTRQTVRLSQLLKERSAYTLMPELGTKPSVYYLPPEKKNEAV